MWWIVEGIFQLLLKVDLCECCHCCAVLRWYKCICRGWTLLFQFHGGLSLVSSEWLCHLTLRGSWVSLSLHDRWPSGTTNTLHLLFRQVTNSLSLCLHLSVFQWMKLLWIIYRHRERCLANHRLHSVAKFLSLVVYVVTWCLWKVFALHILLCPQMLSHLYASEELYIEWHLHIAIGENEIVQQFALMMWKKTTKMIVLFLFHVLFV